MTDSVSFDPIANRYDDTRGYQAGVADQLGDTLLRLAGVPPHSSMLEIGIGTGRIALPLLARGINVTGVDISSKMVEQLQTKYAVQVAAESGREWGTLTVEMADMTALPFATASFDAAVAVHVLHLVPDWKRALDEVLRVVKPGRAFLLGQDTHLEEDLQWRAQGQWLRIVRDLGYNVPITGATGSTAVIEELRARGLPIEETVAASWNVRQTPRQMLTWITDRMWSRTWRVPDDLFAESARRLTAWMEAQYGNVMDVPQSMPIAFKVATVRRP